jgi:hypothetical protein
MNSLFSRKNKVVTIVKNTSSSRNYLSYQKNSYELNTRQTIGMIPTMKKDGEDY